MLNYKAVGVNDFLKLPSLRELEENRYKELRSNGASPRQAERILDRERGKMQDELSRRYTDAMVTYGTNPDGTLNQGTGFALLNRMVQDTPLTAQLFLGEFASPQKVFEANRQSAMAGLNNGAAWDRQAAQIAANWQNAEAQRAAQAENVDKTIRAAVEQSKLSHENAKDLLSWKYILGIGENGGKSNGSQNGLLNEIHELAQTLAQTYGGYEDAYNKAAEIVIGKKYPSLVNADEKTVRDFVATLTDLGYSKEEALKLAAEKIGVKPTKNDEALNKAGNFVANSYNDITEAIKAGDKDLARQRVEAMYEWLRDPKNSELLDLASYKQQLETLGIYEKIISGEYSVDEGSTKLLKRKFIMKHGREPSSDELLEEVRRAKKEGSYIEEPRKKRVETPPLAPPTWVPPTWVPQPQINANIGWNGANRWANPATGYGYIPR